MDSQGPLNADQKFGLTRSSFSLAPIQLLEACRTRKGTLFVYLWLWHHAGANDAAFPSVDALALECGMNSDDTRSSLRWLVGQGWVERQERPGFTPIYHVRSERLGPVLDPSTERGTPPPNGGPLPQTVDPSPFRGTTPLPRKGDPYNKKHITKNIKPIKNPPLVPPIEAPAKTAPAARTAQTASQPAAGHTHPDPVENAIFQQPVEKPVENPVLNTFLISGPSSLTHDAPETPLAASERRENAPELSPYVNSDQQPLERRTEATDKKPAQRVKTAVFCPNNDDIPAALLPIAENIIAFWHHKAGKKTNQAWSLLIAELTKINNYSSHGLDAISEQCSLGINAKINGKGWQSITLSNFIKYGSNNLQNQGKRRGRQDVVEKVHEASQMVGILREQYRRQEEEYFATMDAATLPVGAN